MNDIRKLLVLMLSLALSVGTSIAVCVKGWGLQPKSWWWIIGVYMIGHMAAMALAKIASSDDE